MHAYVESCRSNPSLEVMFVTDLDPFPDSPPNVSYYPLSLDQLKSRIQDLFGVDVSRIEPYKLCDFRPAFGLLFADALEGIDFWGYGDNDLVLGKVDEFITPEKLESYDILSFKQGHLQGPLTIYRNRPEINTLFKDGGEYKKIFANPKYLSFDEFGPSVFYVKIQQLEEVRNCPKDNISVIAFNQALDNKIKVLAEQHGKEDLSHADILVYENDQVRDYHSGTSYLFYHWVLEKRALWFQYPSWFEQRPSRFYMSTTGFYSESEFRTYRYRHAWRIFKGTIQWTTLKVSNYIKRRLGQSVILDTSPRLGWVKKLPKKTNNHKEESRELTLGLGDVTLSETLGAYYIDMRPALIHYTDNIYGGGFDRNGVPFIRSPEGQREYLPVNITQYGFMLHADWIETREPGILQTLKNCLKVLEELKVQRGHAWVWLHEHRQEKYKLDPPWASAMTQGEVISFYLRMYQATGNSDLLETAKGAYKFLSLDHSEGGVRRRDKDGNLWFEEFPSDPPSFVLNGFIYTLFGLYDLYRVTKDESISAEIDACIQTLTKNISRFDAGYWSFYDLAKTELVRYYYQKNVHAPQMRVLHKLTQSPIFEHYALKWENQVNSLNFLLVQLMYRIRPRWNRAMGIFKTTSPTGDHAQ